MDHHSKFTCDLSLFTVLVLFNGTWSCFAFHRISYLVLTYYVDLISLSSWISFLPDPLPQREKVDFVTMGHERGFF